MPEHAADRPENRPNPPRLSAVPNPPSTPNQPPAGDQVRRQGEETVQQLRATGEEAVNSIGEQVRSQVTSQAQSQKERASESLNGVAQALRQTSQHLREQGQDPLAGLAETGAERVERFSGYFRQRDLDQITGDVEQFARRQPALFLGAAFGLGFLASRFLKSSGQLPAIGLTDSGSGSGPDKVSDSIEVNVPVRVAYNQWTQFEEFPRFMEGVQEVRQLDDTRLHWKAEIAGKVEEWDAVIAEQHPDRVIAWHSTSGPQNAGHVTFAPLGPNSTRVTLQMGYRPEGVVENVGSMLGVVERRVKGDLRRFKEFVESRGTPTGAWRGEIRRDTVTKPDEQPRE